VNTFELFVAFRYLRIRRKEAVISVVTLVSVTGSPPASRAHYFAGH